MTETSHSHEEYLAELQKREASARAMGGEKRIARHHAQGSLTARERIDALLDADTFDELGLLAHSDLLEARENTPADGKITGYGAINGRTVFVCADDATVMAGAGGRIGYGKQMEGFKKATKLGYPCVNLGDGGGARIPDIMGATGMMSMTYRVDGEARNRDVPQIAKIMGACYGGPTWTASVSDIVIQVKGAIMAVAGPAILEVATGEKTTAEALGGWEFHAHTTGLVDIVAEDDRDCLWKVRHVLSYFPSNADLMPAVVASKKSSSAPQPILRDLIPTDPKAIYDMRHVLDAIADDDSVLELKPDYEGSLITALARMDGHPVGFLTNNPLVNVGAMGPGACEKAISFICLCDSFHIPLIFLHDTPGFFVGKFAEEHKMAQKIMAFIQALQQSTVPRISLIVRKSYGMAHCNMVGGNMGASILLALPFAEVSFMAPEVAVNVVYGRKLKDLPDPETAKQIMLDEMRQGNTPWEAAGLNLIDKVIDPQTIRAELIRALKRTRGADGRGGRSKRLLANWSRMF
ncbi:MAG: carboxyl transferase domain-containing protein [Aggregatilineales bacterium]